jgi:hypothetical protein
MKTRVVITGLILLFAACSATTAQRTSLVLLPSTATLEASANKLKRYVSDTTSVIEAGKSSVKGSLERYFIKIQKTIRPQRLLIHPLKKRIHSSLSQSVIRTTGLPAADHHKKRIP